MLGIGKLAAAAEDYYLGIAAGTEDYYVGMASTGLLKIGRAHV